MGGARAIEHRTVSRKTPGDGKHGDGALGTMPCTCRGHDKPHVHYFVESDLLRSLAAGSEVDLFLDEDARRLLVVTA